MSEYAEERNVWKSILSNEVSFVWIGINESSMKYCSKKLIYWPLKVDEWILNIRYGNGESSIVRCSLKEKNRRLLKMTNEDNPCLSVEVTSTELDGCQVIFEDGSEGDAPLLLVNGLKNQHIAFSQLGEK